MRKPLCSLVGMCLAGCLWLLVAYQVGTIWGRAYPQSAVVSWRTTDRIEDWSYLTIPYRYPRWHQGAEQ